MSRADIESENWHLYHLTIHGALTHNEVIITAPCPAGSRRDRGEGVGGQDTCCLMFRGDWIFHSFNPHTHDSYVVSIIVSILHIYVRTRTRVYNIIPFISEKPIFALGPKHWTSYRAIIIQNQRPGTVSFQVAC